MGGMVGYDGWAPRKPTDPFVPPRLRRAGCLRRHATSGLAHPQDVEARAPVLPAASPPCCAAACCRRAGPSLDPVSPSAPLPAQGTAPPVSFNPVGRARCNTTRHSCRRGRPRRAKRARAASPDPRRPDARRRSSLPLPSALTQAQAQAPSRTAFIPRDDPKVLNLGRVQAAAG